MDLKLLRYYSSKIQREGRGKIFLKNPSQVTNVRITMKVCLQIAAEVKNRIKTTVQDFDILYVSVFAIII